MPCEAFPDGTYPTPTQRYDWEVHVEHWSGCPAAERFARKKRSTQEAGADTV